ncbi:MAG: PLD nuclease N-terminal domain-containing protein [Actinomycetota bacterium]
MIELDGVVGVALLILWVYCIFDVIAMDNSMMRNLPKPIWLILVIFLGPVGCAAWLFLGRPRGAKLMPGSTESRPPVRRRLESPRSLSAANEDSPEFMRSIEQRRLRQWEEDLKRREEDLKRREGGDE